jgi:hypothetical protein
VEQNGPMKSCLLFLLYLSAFSLTAAGAWAQNMPPAAVPSIHPAMVATMRRFFNVSIALMGLVPDVPSAKNYAPNKRLVSNEMLENKQLVAEQISGGQEDSWPNGRDPFHSASNLAYSRQSIV